MKSIKEYPKPFYSNFLKVFCGDHSMAFDWVTDDKMLRFKILNALNGGIEDLPTVIHTGDTIAYAGTLESILTIRGWGKLIGVGGYNYNNEKAVKIQDKFGKWLETTINNA